jgi:hypothetical protein
MLQAQRQQTNHMLKVKTQGAVAVQASCFVRLGRVFCDASPGHVQCCQNPTPLCSSNPDPAINSRIHHDVSMRWPLPTLLLQLYCIYDPHLSASCVLPLSADLSRGSCVCWSGSVSSSSGYWLLL